MELKKLIIFLAVLIIQACASGGLGTKSSSDTMSDIKAALDQGVQDNTHQMSNAKPPQAVADALLPRYQNTLADGIDQIEERFDMTVNKMNARLFFMSLVRDTAINLVVHPDVKGNISLDLKSVTIEEVLEVARDVYGYEFQKNRAGYFIMPAKLRSKIFSVGYLNVQRKGESNTKVSSGQFITSHKSSNNNNQNNSSKNNISSEVPSSRVTTKSESDFWQDIRNTISILIGDEEGRTVIVNPQSGLVVVRAMPNELRDVEDFLKNAQQSLTRQVIIEAKVIEVQLNGDFQSGVNWAKLEEDASRTNTAGQFLFNGKASALFDSNGGISTTGLVGDSANSGFKNLMALGTATDDFAYIISLLDSQGEVEVLSSPRVSTVNNQKAVIKVGNDEYFVTGVSSTTTTGTSTSTTPEIELTPFFSGIALDVTPQINDDSEVILHIHPSISEVVDQVKEITIFGVDQSLPLAFSTVRESDSIVRAKSGQVIIIGGLMQNQTSDVEGGVPGLKEIPILGHLFKQHTKISKRSELVILLKPTVIGEDGRVWRDEIQRISTRIDSVKR